ncbi:response regulator [uncultured Chitinophaga sp.]|uniref:response regulator n=1 Tax=uncultured Chitinophaga sp. TaxID=339340 RepID=UPI00260E87F2|nr:response regulator [uncultured Chitinophaga sp.]
MTTSPINPNNNVTTGNLSNVKLLIAEDDDIAQMILRKQLEPYTFYHIFFCSDGDDFMTMLETINPDLVIMDVRLPNISGLDLACQVRNHPKFEDIPILMLSASAFREDIKAGLDAGATEYITKPYNVEKFLERLLYYTMEVAERRNHTSSN